MIEKKYILTLRILFALAIILLASELLVSKIFPGSYHLLKPVVTEEKADSAVVQILSDFGVNKKEYTRKNNKYIVSLPYDLPSELISLDIIQMFKEHDLTIKSRELKKGSQSELKLFSDEENILTIEFTYDYSRRRYISAFAFILVNPENLSQSELSDIINSQENFSLALYPSKKNRLLAGSLNSIGKQYSLIINNKINELEYKLDDKFSDRKIKITFQTIISHFHSSVLYIVDDISGDISPRVVSILKNELGRRKIKYHSLNDFEYLRDFSGNNILGKYLEMKKEQVFIIEAGEFGNLKNEITRLRKRGLRIANVSAISGLY
jgi:hypothetical protein